MKVHLIQSVEVCSPVLLKGERQKWAKERAHRLQRLFEQWQEPLGISNDEYGEYQYIRWSKKENMDNFENH